jgi:hypothetical protein
MDEHIPRSITVGLRLRGVDVLTAQEDDRSQADDVSLLDRAMGLGRVMFSFDADMVRIAAERQREGIRFAGLAFAHPTHISVGECIRDLEILAKSGQPEDVVNEVVFLPL